jgi:hypothetical protein
MSVATGTPLDTLGSALLALGSVGGDRCVDGTAPAAGVHLLWTVEPGLGFPVGGYDVARRRHQPLQRVSLPFDQPGVTGGEVTWTSGAFTVAVSAGPVALDDACGGPARGLALAGPARTLTVTYAESYGVAVSASGVGAPPVVEATGPAAGPDAVLARRTAHAEAGRWSVDLWAPGVTDARITGDDLLVCTFTIGVAGPWDGWEPLTRRPVLLPLVPPGSRNALDQVDDRAATVSRARSRLSDALPSGTADRLADDLAGAPRAAVERLLREGPGARLPAVASAAQQAAGAPQLGLDVTVVLGLAALDPNVSRMLGLTWHDPDTSGRWDYRVTGHYGPVRFPGTMIRFDGLLPGARAGGVLRVGGTTVVGSGGLEVLAAADASHCAVLRVRRPLLGAPAGLILPPGTRSVRLRPATAGGGDGIVFTGRRGDRDVAVVTGGSERLVVIEDAGGLETVTWSGGPLDLADVELAAIAGTVGDQAAYAWNVSAQDRKPVGALALVDVGADADAGRPGPDGRLPVSAGVVGADWEPAGDVRGPGLPVRTQVALSWRGRSAQPAPDGPVTLVEQNLLPLAVTRAGGQAGSWPGPQVPQRWTYTVADPGWYALRVRGIDAFGRLGSWTADRTVQVAASPEPGAPAGLTARYLDPADPDLSDADRALSAGTAGVVVGWAWPVGRRLAAPAVDGTGEFRIYLHRGDPNLAIGTVLAVRRGVGRSTLDTDVHWAGPADALAGQLLRLGGVSYPILGHDSGSGVGVEVAHVSGPLRRPGTGPFSVTVAQDSGRYVGFGRSGDFQFRAAVLPAQGADPVTAVVRTVAETADGAEVTLTDPLVLALRRAGGPSTPSNVTVAVVPGVLLCRGVAYPVLAQGDGSAVVRIGAARRFDGAPLLPAAGDTCTVWSGTTYQAWLPGVLLEPDADEAVAVGFVGVAACDGDPAAADDPCWDRPGRGGLGGRTGREGPTGRAARVAAPHRVPPPALPVTRPPEVDGDVPAVRAEPADWYGRAHWPVPLDPVDGAVGYRVLRASTAALFAYDLSLRRTGREPYADGPFPDDGASASWLAEHHPSVPVADLTADPTTLPAEVAADVAATWRDWSAWFYPRLNNRAVMDLADLDTHREPFRPAHPGTVPGPVYVDTMDGRGAGRFVYRVRTVDASGTAGPWSATLPIVELRDVTPPKTPTLLSVLGEEDAVSLAWRSGTEPDLAGYRIWRSADPAELTDVRRLPAYAEMTATGVGGGTGGGDGTGAALWTGWTDAGPAPLTQWFYRVAAVDRAGNVSPPTDVVSARPIHTEPPEPPTWTEAVRDGSTAVLAWSVAQDGVACMVERQRGAERIFTSRSGWLSSGPGPREFGWTDDEPGSGVVTYRIRARDVTGNEQRYRWNPVTVPAAEEGA